MTRMRTVIQRAKEVYSQAVDLDILISVPVLTLGVLLLHGGSAWYLTVPLTVLCIAGLAIRPLLSSPNYWLLLTAVLCFGNLRNWYEIDNHKYLTIWWSLALYCSLLTENPREALATQGRWLVGLCFGFAVLWKVIAPDYLTGSFFRMELLADGRFDDLARLVGGVPQYSLKFNLLRLAELKSFDSTLESVQLASGPRVPLLATFMTWWTIIIELVLALAWLLPDRFGLVRWRHPLLILFVLTTYSIANVVGYGWLLFIMGLAHCPPDHRRTRAMYYACFVFLHLFLIPFSLL